MYRLRLTKRAQKDLDRLRGVLWERVSQALSGLREAPRPAGCRKLRSGDYRIRVGDYLAIYSIDDAERVVSELKVQHRRDVYREL